MVDERAWESLLREIMHHFRDVVQEHLEKFTRALRGWMIQMTTRPLPADWRKQTAEFLVEWERKGCHLSPQSIALVEWWIEGRAPRMAELAGTTTPGTSSGQGHAELHETVFGNYADHDKQVSSKSASHDSFVRVATTRDQPSGQIKIQQVSYIPSVGHHWTPRAVLLDLAIFSNLSREAFLYAVGSYSGPTDPKHNYGTYGGVKHSSYNDAVKKELLEFIAINEISPENKMTPQQMAEFCQLTADGLDAHGKKHPVISKFNNAIKKSVVKGTKLPKTMDEIISAGAKYAKHPRFRLMMAVSGALGDLVYEHVNALETIARSENYKRAMRALQDGDVMRARQFLLGRDQSVFAELLSKNAIVALNFKAAMEKVFESAHQ